MILSPAGSTEWAQTASGLILPVDLAEQTRRPTCLDLFCGAGGFSLGMERAGFDVLAACDNESLAAITYLINLGAYPCQFYWLDDTAEARMEKALQQELKRYKKGEIAVPPISGSARSTPGDCRHFFFGDIRNLRGQDVLRALGMKRGELDCIVGGPPCQGYSMAGKRNVMDPRNSLVFEFARLVCEIQPKTMCLENVPGILTMTTEDGLPVVEALCLALSEGGFGTLDSLRRALGSDKGRRAALRGEEPPAGTGKRGSSPPMPHDDRQLTFFSTEAR